MNITRKFWQQPLQGYNPWHVDKRRYVFEQDTAERVIDFWESTFVLSKSGEAFMLEDWQKQVVGHLFAWKRRRDGNRRYRKLWLYVPRKNGKTEMGAGMALIGLVADNELGSEVYSAARDTNQAKRVYDAASAMVRGNKRLRDGVQIFPGYKSMKYDVTQSYYRVLSSDAAGKHGLNPHMFVIDEVHGHPSSDLIEAIETGVGARNQPLGIYMTTADYERDSVCNTYHEYAKKVRDDQIDDTWLPVIFETDADADWHDETVWYSANPNLGVSKTLEYMRDQHRQAANMPDYEYTFKRLELNIQTKAKNKWLDGRDWKRCIIETPDLLGEDCYVAVDMGATRDMTAVGMFFPNHMFYDCMFWVPGETLDRHLEYQAWERMQRLRRTPGRTINSEYMRTYIRDEIGAKYNILDIAYDPWNAVELAVKLNEEDDLPVTEFRQGFRSMNEPAKRLERLVLDHGVWHNANPVLGWMVDNVEIQTDPAGNIKPVKPHKDSPKKVDGIITLAMCVGLWINNEGEKTTKIYAQRMAETGEPMLVL